MERQRAQMANRGRRLIRQWWMALDPSRLRLVWMWVGIVVVAVVALGVQSRGRKAAVRVDQGGIQPVIAYLDAHENELVQWLDEAVKIRSVSVGSQRSEAGLAEARDHFKELAVRVGLDKITVTDGSPGVLLAQSSAESSERKTVLIYAHWDVQPAENGSGGWLQDPFRMWREGDRLHGRGVSDDKSALVGWLWVLEAFRQAGIPYNVNIRLFAEGEEEIGSPELPKVVEREKKKGGFFDGVDFAIISDGSFLTDQPCVVIGTRGVLHVDVRLSGPEKDLHSGIYGGGVHEPLSELVQLISTLSDGRGTVLVDGIESVAFEAIDKEELTSVDMNMEQWAADAGVSKGTYEGKEELLRRMWGEASLTIHGVQSSADYDAASIPASARAHFSIRLPPGMNPIHLRKVVHEHLKGRFGSMNSPNLMEVDFKAGTPAFSGSSSSSLYHAIRNAMKRARDVDPGATRLGGSLPVASLLASEMPNTDVVILPISGSDDGAHGFESMAQDNLYLGVKTFAYLLEALASS